MDTPKRRAISTVEYERGAEGMVDVGTAATLCTELLFDTTQARQVSSHGDENARTNPEDTGF